MLVRCDIVGIIVHDLEFFVCVCCGFVLLKFDILDKYYVWIFLECL